MAARLCSMFTPDVSMEFEGDFNAQILIWQADCDSFSCMGQPLALDHFFVMGRMDSEGRR